MKYPLDLLKDQLKEVENAKAWCLKNGNKEDYKLIIKYKENPLKEAIKVLRLSMKYKLFKDE